MDDGISTPLRVFGITLHFVAPRAVRHKARRISHVRCYIIAMSGLIDSETHFSDRLVKVNFLRIWSEPSSVQTSKGLGAVPSHADNQTNLSWMKSLRTG